MSRQMSSATARRDGPNHEGHRADFGGYNRPGRSKAAHVDHVPHQRRSK